MANVILELRADHLSSNNNSVVVKEALTLTQEEWAALTDQIGDWQDLHISAPRNVLAHNATYYRALFGEFREAGFDRITVNWDRGTFLNLLRFIFVGQCDISAASVVKFVEAATFFGVDKAISAVDDWANLGILSRERRVINEILENLPSIWDTCNTLGYQSLSKFCPEFLAVNFVTVMNLNSFVDLPYALLRACIVHRQLTVNSERQLCEALLRWSGKQDQGSQPRELEADESINILAQVRRALLPKDFLLGRLRDDDLLDASNTIIRMTDYLECLDLSGCYEVTDRILFMSSAMRLPDHPDPALSSSKPGGRSSLSLSSSFYNVPIRHPSLPRIPTFENLHRLDLTQCWRIPQDSLVIWLGEACPNLLELILKNCPQITFSILQALPTVCPQLRNVDISLDVTDVSKDVQMYSTEENSSWARGDASGLWRCSFAGLTKLSLRGHTEITDFELVALGVCSPPLNEIDLSMCTALTDGGIWRFLKRYPGLLKSFKAKGTAFGSMSCRALIYATSSNQDSTQDPNEGLLSSNKDTVFLATLDIECCLGAKEEDLAYLLGSQTALTHLRLAETNLTDMALSLFSGTSLQQLDVRGTEVSGQALASVIRSNPALKMVDIRGCKRACINKYDLLVIERDSGAATRHAGTVSVPLIFEELGRLASGVEGLKVGWGFNYSGQLAIQSVLRELKSLSVGIGGTITDAALQDISEHSTALKKVNLAFQVITEDGLIRFLDRTSCLHTLNLQYCLTQISSRGIDAIGGRCSSLSILKLERVAPWIVDNDISVLSERCTGLSHLSLVGCRALTEESLKTIARNWRGLIQLKLEECNRLTSKGADCILQSCGALEVLTLRHNGKGIAKDFIRDAVVKFPLLRHLSLDMCDSVSPGFQTPIEVKGVLNTVLIARCKPHNVGLLGPTAELDSSVHGSVHKETIVYQWNVDVSKIYTVKDRL